MGIGTSKTSSTSGSCARLAFIHERADVLTQSLRSDGPSSHGGNHVLITSRTGTGSDADRMLSNALPVSPNSSQ